MATPQVSIWHRWIVGISVFENADRTTLIVRAAGIRQMRRGKYMTPTIRQVTFWCRVFQPIIGLRIRF